MNSHKLIIGRQKGFTLLEVIIALVIFTLGILGVAAMQLRAIQGNSSGQRLTEATAQAQDMIERIMEEPLANFIPPVAGIALPISTATTVPPYTVTRNVDVLPGGSSLSFNQAVLVTVNVTWREATGANRTVTVSFIKSKNLEDSYAPLI